MTESVNRSDDRITNGNRLPESHERTDERTDVDPPDRVHISDPPQCTREDEIESDLPISKHPHPRDIPAHHRKPEIQRLRAILRVHGAKMRGEDPDDGKSAHS